MTGLAGNRKVYRIYVNLVIMYNAHYKKKKKPRRGGHRYLFRALAN